MSGETFRRARSYYQQLSGRYSSRRKRYSEEETIDIDFTVDLSETFEDILLHIVDQQHVNKARKLAYLNGFVKFITQVPAESEINVSPDAVIFSLRTSLLHKFSIIRTAGLRALRYYINTPEKVTQFHKYKLDFCVARCLDLHYTNDQERNQAVRLCRHILHMCPTGLQPSLVLPFVAIVDDGATSSDRMLLAALEFLCEIAYKNTELLVQCGGLKVILQYIVDCPDEARINEPVTQTVLYLLNLPQKRASIKDIFCLDQLLAPFTDKHFRHKNDITDNTSKPQEAIDRRCQASLRALTTSFHSWPGLITLCSAQSSAIPSLVSALPMESCACQKNILELLYTILLLKIPDWTDDFEQALQSCDPSAPDPSWELREEFIAAECMSVFTMSRKNRPNLIDNHLALLLSSLIANQALECLSKIAIIGSPHISVWATILLGEILYMSYLLLPWPDCEKHKYLPVLMLTANSCDSPVQREQANEAVANLDRIHSLKKRGKQPYSLHLQMLVSFIPRREKALKNNLSEFVPKDSEEMLTNAIRESLVLVEPKYRNWDWHLVKTILSSDESALKKVEELLLSRFLAKLLLFYSPQTEDGFSTVKQADENARLLSSIGAQLVQTIIELDMDEPKRGLRDFLFELRHCLMEIRQEMPVHDAKLGLNNIFHMCCQEYFLFFGKLSHIPEGLVLLETTGIMQQLLDLVTITSHDAYVKLIVSSMDYTKDGVARVLLSKALTATSESARLYTADFVRTLLRIGMPFFSSWCMELLVTQLYDQSKPVAMKALSVIDEACEDKANLLSLIKIKPSVLHLGELGALLVTRYASVHEGFEFLRTSGYLQRDLLQWKKQFNVTYVEVVECKLSEALTTYKKSYDSAIQRRSSAKRLIPKTVYVPSHLYGQLVQHGEGSDVVANEPHVCELMDELRHAVTKCASIQLVKAALWAAGHIGTSLNGLKILDREEIIPVIVKIATEAEVLSLRGTAFYALGLIGSTQGGVTRLAECGWRSIMNDRSTAWPVLSEQLLYSDPAAMKDARSMSQNSQSSQTSQLSATFSEDDVASKYEDEGLARSRASTDVEYNSKIVQENESLYEAQADKEPFQGEVRQGKAHSTSELQHSRLPQHKRSSSDSLSQLNLLRSDHIPHIVVEPSSSEISLKLLKASSPRRNLSDSEDNSQKDQNQEERSQGECSELNERLQEIKDHPIKQRTQRSSILSTPPNGKTNQTRSLSWRLEVVNNEASTLNPNRSDSMSSHISADSVISQSPQNGAVNQSSSEESDDDIDEEAESGHKKKKKHITRRRHWSLSRSTTQPITSQRQTSSWKGVTGYSAHKDELSYAALRALKRQTIASSDSKLAYVPKNTAPITSPPVCDKKASLIRSLSKASDIDLLTVVRKESNSLSALPAISSTLRYIGIALPMDINSLFTICVSGGDSSDSDSSLMDRKSSRSYSKDSEPADDGLQYHSLDNCIKCVNMWGVEDGDGDNGVRGEPDGQEYPEEVAIPANYPGRVSILRTEDVLESPESESDREKDRGDSITEYTPSGKCLLRRECMRFISSISSSIGVSAAEDGLLRLRERFPIIFQDLCLYSEVLSVLSTYAFHLPARRFIQELFEHTTFDVVLRDAESMLPFTVEGSCCAKHVNAQE